MKSQDYYDDGTITRAHKALVASGITEKQAHEAINACLNAGIVFRESLRSAYGCTKDPCPWPHEETRDDL